MSVRRFDIYGSSENSKQGQLYDVDEVIERLKWSMDDETKDDIITNICASFEIPLSEIYND